RSLKRPLHIHTKGEGFLGCLGQGDFFPRENLEPVKSLKGIDVRQVSSGWSHSAAVTRDGHLLVWGRPYDFKGSLRLSNLNRFAPIMVRAVNAFADSREVMTEPTIMPIIGQEVSTEGGPSMRVDVKVASVGCSSALTAVLTDAGHVYCMGQNRWGQCGVGSENPKHILSPTRSGGVLLKDEKPILLRKESLVTELIRQRGLSDDSLFVDAYARAMRSMAFACLLQVVRMALGFQHVLVLSESGKVFGWGKGERGQLGSTETDVRTAVRVPLPSKAVSVSCGFNHSVAVLESGEVYVWGKMQNPEVRDSSGPVPVYHDQHEPRRVKVASPEISAGDISDVVITEAVCGSYTTVLRSECGRLFIFGIMSDTRHILHTPREV
ncbi:unnamed protein product, partial [Choristocarpus tenellus]